MATETPCPYPVDELVPHSGDMSLLDEVVSFSEETLTARVVIGPQSTFFHDGGVPAWVGIEYMAQAVAAWAGCGEKRTGGNPKVGFLLGSRKFSSSCAVFPQGAELIIHIERELQDDSGLGSFQCSLTFDDQQQQARLNVFQPPDAAAFMETAKG